MQNVPRTVLVFLICIPLALWVGTLAAAPDSNSLQLLVLIFGIIALPALLRWHHLFLLLSWNAYLNVPGFPGTPPLWSVLAALSLGIFIVRNAINRKFHFLMERSLAWPLLAMGLLVAVTGSLRGGLSVNAAGSSLWGGRNYFYIFAAIAGCFAITGVPIAPEKSSRIVALYFLSPITALISNLIYLLGPVFYFLYFFFDTEFLDVQVQADYGPLNSNIFRIAGLSFAGYSIILFVLARYGLGWLFRLRSFSRFKGWWYACLIAGSILAVLLGGFRVWLFFVVILLAAQFFLEGLHRTKILLFAMIAASLCGVTVLTFSDKMPLAVQRTLSFLPVKIDNVARLEAQETARWRFEMWSAILDEAPKYLLLGKGYKYDRNEYESAKARAWTGEGKPWEPYIIDSSYHSGPLSLLVPLGLGGSVVFVWFLFAAGRILYRNYRYSPVPLLKANTCLLAFFITQTIFYIFAFGDFAHDFARFAGAVGLSISLNRSVQSVQKTPAAATKFATGFKLEAVKG